MIRTKLDRATRLLTLESEEKRLRERMNRDRVRRTLIQEEMTKLRCTMKDAEAERYRKRKFQEERL